MSSEDQRSQKTRESKKPERQAVGGALDVEEHIGPVQFNIGGIQMDAEDMVKRLKVRCSLHTYLLPTNDAVFWMLMCCALQDREANRAAEPERPMTPPSKGEQEPMDNAQLASFFAGLIKPKGGSAANSPKRDTRRSS